MNVNKSKKVVLITGASSGFGMDAALRLLELGYTVYGAARRTELLKEIDKNGGHSLFLDLTDEKSVEDCVSLILKKEGRIDVLINNAGYGLGGPVEFVPIAEGKRQFDVNLFGMAKMIQLVLPSMRENHYGKIINIASVAGKIASPYLGWYNATKFAVEGFSDTLRREVSQFGIKVVVIEPGPINTDWGVIASENIEKFSKDTPYEKDADVITGFFSKFYGTDRAKDKISLVTKAIEKAVVKENPKSRYSMGSFSKIGIISSKIFSDRILDFFMRQIFK